MIKILKEENEKMVIEIDDLTLANIISEYLWDVRGVRFAGFVREHPYLEKPKIIVNASDPKKAVSAAGKKIIDDVESIRKQLKK